MSDEREELVTAEDSLNEAADQEEVLVEDNHSEEESNEVVERAKKYGHLSKEEWVAQGRNPDDWKSPEEFDKTGKILEQLYSMRKKVDQRDREIQALVDYQQRTSQREYERARQDLEQRLAASKDDMDVESVAHYTKELVRLEDMEQQNQAQKWQQIQAQVQANFIERNQHWFNDRNPDLKQRAIEIDNELKNVYPNATFEELAQKIETRMRYEYPDRVGSHSSPSRPAVSSTQSSINKASVVKKSTFKNLSQEHKDTYNVYKRINPKITEDEFIQRLKADGEI